MKKAMLSMFLAVALLWGYQVSALAMERYLPISVQIQQNTNWCWAASSVAMLNMRITSKTPTTQTAHAQFVQQSTSNNKRSIDNIYLDFVSANKYGRTCTWNALNNKTGHLTLSYSTIVSQINANKPILCDLAMLPNYFDGHFVVIAGYWDANSSIYIMDPYDGCKYFSYYTFLNNYNNGASWYWDSAIYNFS